MDNPLIIRIAKGLSIAGVIMAMMLCGLYYFDRDVELGTLIYVYLLLASAIALVLTLLLLFFMPGNRLRRKKLLVALAFVVSAYTLVLLMTWPVVM